MVTTSELLLLLLVIGADHVSSQIACSTLHPACTQCSTSSGRRRICNSCSGPAYVVSADQTACGCAPGYYNNSTSSNATAAACALCPKGSWCPGGSAAAAARNSCGAFLTSVSTGAVSPASCITQPGAAYMSGAGTAHACKPGYYNAGGNRRNCTACPVGMSTTAAGASSSGACTAKPGWFYQSRIALPCPQGTYKPSLSNSANGCTRCPAGSTTRSIHSTTLSDCSVALPGYQLDWQSPSTPQPVACPVGTYSNGYTTEPCRTCPLGLQTPSTGSSSAAACSAPPGAGFYRVTGTQPLGVGPVSTKMLQDSGSPCVLQCPAGSFKEGWGLGPCLACGVNFRSPEGATFAQQCDIPVGWGSTPARNGSQLLVARKCLKGQYGVSQPQHGITRKYPCQPCAAHMTTPDMAPNITSLTGQEAVDALAAIVVSSAQQCVTLPGYGFNGSQGVRCQDGFYAVGYSRDTCTHCGQGLTTVQMGASMLDDCIAIPGWQRKQRQGLLLEEPYTAEECPVGTWGSGGTDPCQPCPASTTTASAGATDVSECEALNY